MLGRSARFSAARSVCEAARVLDYLFAEAGHTKTAPKAVSADVAEMVAGDPVPAAGVTSEQALRPGASR